MFRKRNVRNCWKFRLPRLKQISYYRRCNRCTLALTPDISRMAIAAAQCCYRNPDYKILIRIYGAVIEVEAVHMIPPIGKRSKAHRFSCHQKMQFDLYLTRCVLPLFTH
ncbi:hypothetical protein AVEN_230716-1 [Araneus ventricosus]|uniref:Uncharacterized protein n=1 Tax=Araneus ventricosus TaxID=182803 RepID=A0A4Y2A1X1_ARAVE|nr:hypothetical protein AVEN_230716-1 [Araneus ventricosus]